MIKIIRGEFKEVLVRMKDKVTEDPFDLTDVQMLRVCLQDQDDVHFYKFYLPKLGDTSTGSDLILNINTDSILEGTPIAGTGIPAGATVLKTPLSAVDPTAANTIKISVNAIATNLSVSLILGDIELLLPIQWGKFKFFLQEADTEKLGSGSFELTIVKEDKVTIKQFIDEFEIIDSIC